MLGRFLITGCLLAFSWGTLAAEVSEAELREKLTQSLPPQAKIAEIQWVKSLNLFRVVMEDFNEIYVTPDGTHFILGEEYSLKAEGKLENNSQNRRHKKQFALVKSIPLSETIIFPAQGETKAWMLVFTDIDCGYCRLLHSEIDKINKLGIEVRYAAFPRAGLDSGSFNKAEDVWCAANQQQAMTQAKLGKTVTSKACDNPVAAQYDLGRRVGVKGTPTIFLSNGEVVPGYLSSLKLAEALSL